MKEFNLNLRVKNEKKNKKLISRNGTTCDVVEG